MKIPILGRGKRSVIQVKHLRGEDGEPTLLEFGLHGRGDEALLATVAARDVGLPVTYDELLSRPEPPEFHLPPATFDAVRDQLSRSHPAGDPLWMSLDSPRRMTALVPWERLLAPMGLGRVLRAPQLPLLPVAPTEVHRVAFCVNLADGQSLSALAGTASLLKESLEREHRGGSVQTFCLRHFD